MTRTIRYLGQQYRLAKRKRVKSNKIVSSFLKQAVTYANLSAEEEKVLKPYVEKIVEGKLNKESLVNLFRHKGGHDPRFDKEKKEPLWWALQFLFNNIKYIVAQSMNS